VKSELRDFYNDGFGWVCRRCESELARADETDEISRLMREGESESKHPTMANRALAKWADAAQTILECPRCGFS